MTNKYVVITGASAGIGAAAAQKFAEMGRNLILIARRLTRLETLKAAILSQHPELDVVIVQQDLAQVTELEGMYQRLNAQYDLELWINNAGFGKMKNLGEFASDEIRQMVQTNSEAVAILSNLFTRDHAQQVGAQLVNVSSLAGYRVWPGSVMYSATKYFVSALTEGLNHELIAQNAPMRAKVLAPSATETEFQQVAKDLATSVDYQQVFDQFNTATELADFMVTLLDNDATLGIVNANFELELSDGQLPN
ncbi:SDR family NAD(P)-dependent oxidoreductase [Lactiplantibacillus herbarum]|uniref:SDR family NAD(P)-dependent oxidoreductase n=1 Tax=Lactiplantibacillus herbarum TaxID=1670446 RepID=UPI00064E51B7|nr:SDR family NAD(P)-dependent oxidoreductase [Lactiplantibacillus herbarum]